MKLYVLIGLSVSFVVGCMTSPQLQARIDTCSREANAYSAGSRFGNSAYWNCLDREEKRQNAQIQYQQQQAVLDGYKNKCDRYGFRRGTTEFSQCVQQAEQQDIQRQSLAAQQAAAAAAQQQANLASARQQSQQQRNSQPMTADVVGGSTAPIDLGGRFNKGKNCVSTVQGNTVYTNCQ